MNDACFHSLNIDEILEEGNFAPDEFRITREKLIEILGFFLTE
jgi:hypothetical protein